ncbi:MAG TPA: porin [Longimicrobiales bacterium]
MRKAFGLWMMIAVCGAVSAQAQTIEAGDVKLRLLGRVQAQFSTTSVDEAELMAAGGEAAAPIPASMFETRRIRFGAELEFKEWLTGKLETEFGMARLQVRDAYLNMGFDPRLELRVGQFKKPFSLLQLTSSSVWPMIERGVRIRGLGETLLLQDSLADGARVLQTFRGNTVIGEEQDLLDLFLYQNFELGATIHGKFGGLGYSAGVFNGSGWDRPDDTNDKSFAGRLTYKLPLSIPATIGAGVSHREFRTSSTPTITTRGGTAFEADLEVGAFRRKGLHLLAEVALGDNLQAPDDEFLGAQGILSFFQPLDGQKIEGLELAGRASYGDPRRDIEGDSGLLLTPGINLYFFGRNRLMFNWDVFNAGDRFETENALRAQAQLYF